MTRAAHQQALLEREPDGADTSGSAVRAQRSLERARLAADMGKFPTALVLVRTALELAPDESSVQSLYGLLLARNGGDLATALDACRRAVETQPYAARWHAHLAAVYAAAGLLPQAAACARAALALDPHDALAAQTLAESGDASGWRTRLARRVRRAATPAPA